MKSPKIVRTGGYLGEEFSCLNLITSGMKRRDEVFLGFLLTLNIITIEGLTLNRI